MARHARPRTPEDDAREIDAAFRHYLEQKNKDPMSDFPALQAYLRRRDFGGQKVR